MYNIIRWGILIVLLVLLAGCIKPVEEKPTPGPTSAIMPPTPTFGQPPATVAVATVDTGAVATPAPSAFLPLVQQFLQSRGVIAPDLRISYDQALAPDQLLGFSYTDPNGQLCSGYLLAVNDGTAWVPNVGGSVCGMQPGVAAHYGTIPILPTGQQPLTLVFGRVDDTSVTAISAAFDDGSSQNADPNNGGFMIVKPGIAGVTTVVAANQLGNTFPIPAFSVQ
ncbi:MAG TPA: hypothetical protein VHP83_18185 [Aggregatilineaceae bacterium]|nr:hypothetical protein [Aggregatilineaceae bacterium]